MAFTKTQIANIALYNMGGKALNNVDTDSSQQAIVIRAWFDTARDEMLRSHAWNFATQRIRLTTDYNYFTDTPISNYNGSVQIHWGHHQLKTGNRINISEVDGLSINGSWYVTVIDNDHFVLDGSVYSDGYVSNTGKWVEIPVYKWNYQFPLPGDCLRVISLENQEDNFAVESGYILADTDEILVKYVSQVTDTTAWPSDFTNAFAMLLTSYIAQALNGEQAAEINYRKLYEQMLKPLIKFTDSNEGRQKIVDYDQHSEIILARKGAFFW